MSIREAARELIDALGQAHAPRFADRPAFDVIDLVAVQEENSAGVPQVFEGRIGQAVVYVQAGGVALGVGDRVLGERLSADPLSQQYRYDTLIASDNPGSGFMLVDANIPAPLFGAPPSTTTLIATGGSITAGITINLLPVEERFRPSAYAVSWAYVVGTGEWHSVIVNHVAGAAVLPVLLGNSFAPGVQIYVKLETIVNYAQRRSPESSAITVTAATDTGSPATISSVTVSVDASGQLVITPNATYNDILFMDFEYSIATSAAGAGAVLAYARGPLTVSYPTGTTRYVAVRARAKNGAYGNRVPSDPSTWAGPYTTIAPPPPADTTAPGAIGAPTLAVRSTQAADNAWHGFITITRAAGYVEPADYAATEISITNTDGRGWLVELPAGVTVWDGEVGFGQFTVAMRGRDKTGNRGTFGTSAVITNTPPALSNAAPTVVASTVGAGIRLDWNRITGALDYEIQRANSATPGSGGTFAQEVGTDSPLIWLQSNETSGTVATNSGSYGTNGAYNNGAAPHAQAPEGLFGIGFDGIDDNVSWADNAALDITGDLTLEALVYPTSRADYQMIITKATSATGPYQWYLAITSGLPFFADTNGNLTATAAPPLNQWSTIAVKRAGRVVTHYLNGATNGSATIAGAAPAASADLLYIGRRSEAGPQYHFVGRIANPAIFTTALSTARLLAHHSAVSNPPPVTKGYSDALLYFDPLALDTIVRPSYWYRVRARSVQDGAIIVGTWSAWVEGRAGAIDAQNLRLQSVTAELLAANSVLANAIAAGAVTAGKLTADLILATMIRSANSGARYEIEGATGGGGANQMRFYDAAGLRSILNGNGLYLYDTGGGVDAEFTRLNNHAFLSLGRNPSYAQRALDIYWDGSKYVSRFDMYAAQLRFSNIGGAVLLRDGSTSGGYSNIPQLYREYSYPGGPVLQVASVDGGGTLSLHADGIEANNGGASTFLNTAGIWYSGHQQVSTYLRVKGSVPHYTTYPFQIGQVGTQSDTGGAADLPISAMQYFCNDGSYVNSRVLSFNGQATTSWADKRFLEIADINGGGALGGGFAWGFRNGLAFCAMQSWTTAVFYYNATNARMESAMNLHVNGALSATSKPFVIDHPDPAKTDTHELRHMSVEGPTRGQTIYLYHVSLGPRGGNLAVTDSEGRPVDGCTVKDLHAGKAGKATGPARWSIEIRLPDYFQHLNELPRCLASNTGDTWGQCKASVNGAGTELTLLAEEGGQYTIMVVAVRKDAGARAIWDRRRTEKRKHEHWADEAVSVRRDKLAIRARMAERRAAMPTRPTVPADVPTAGADTMAEAMHRAPRRRAAVDQQARTMAEAMAAHVTKGGLS